MDGDDQEVSQEVFSKLHSLLAYKTKASTKYKGIRRYENTHKGSYRQYDIDIESPEEYSA